jgi:hypothetical protein
VFAFFFLFFSFGATIVFAQDNFIELRLCQYWCSQSAITSVETVEKRKREEDLALIT